MKAFQLVGWQKPPELREMRSSRCRIGNGGTA
jgi:hypothetical protein